MKNIIQQIKDVDHTLIQWGVVMYLMKKVLTVHLHHLKDIIYVLCSNPSRIADGTCPENWVPTLHQVLQKSLQRNVTDEPKLPT